MPRPFCYVFSAIVERDSRDEANVPATICTHSASHSLAPTTPSLARTVAALPICCCKIVLLPSCHRSFSESFCFLQVALALPQPVAALGTAPISLQEAGIARATLPAYLLRPQDGLQNALSALRSSAGAFGWLHRDLPAAFAFSYAEGILAAAVDGARVGHYLHLQYDHTELVDAQREPSALDQLSRRLDFHCEDRDVRRKEHAICYWGMACRRH